MLYDPVAAAREFHDAYGIATVDAVHEREAAVTAVTARAAGISESTESLVGALWSLLTDLEAAASDEVLGMDLEMTADCAAQLLAALYELCDVLALAGVHAKMAKVHQLRMGAVETYRPPTAGSSR